MSKKRMIKLRSRIMEALDLPEETMGGVPKVTMVGISHMLVENHMGIYEYTETGVRLNSKCGIIHISGRGLVMGELNHERLFITGCIDGVHYE